MSRAKRKRPPHTLFVLYDRSGSTVGTFTTQAEADAGVSLGMTCRQYVLVPIRRKLESKVTGFRASNTRTRKKRGTNAAS